MSRAMKDAGEAFRVREDVVWHDGPGGSSTFFHGPYATLATARGVRTRREARSWGGARSFTVEKTSTVWVEVPDPAPLSDPRSLDTEGDPL